MRDWSMHGLQNLSPFSFLRFQDIVYTNFSENTRHSIPYPYDYTGTSMLFATSTCLDLLSVVVAIWANKTLDTLIVVCVIIGKAV